MSGLYDQQEREYEKLLPYGNGDAGASGYCYANCPAITVADMKGVAEGAYPQQYGVSRSGHKFNDVVSANGHCCPEQQDQGNPDLPALANRIPPTAVVYDSVGKYGGTLDVLSTPPRLVHPTSFPFVVNFVRYSDDLLTIVPNVAKDWKFNEDFTELTFYLRKGHKWSDGHPFTAEDVKFWYDHLMMDPKVFAEQRIMLLSPVSG